jgi:hypothetical protein
MIIALSLAIKKKPSKGKGTLDMKKMESAAYCPICGGPISMVMEPYGRQEKNFIAGIAALLEGASGISGTTHFEGECKCACGKKVMATLHITAFNGEKA